MRTDSASAAAAIVPVLFVHNGLDWITGSERCLLDLVSHLDRRRFRPVVVCNGASLAAAAEQLGATVYSGEQYGDSTDRFLPRRTMVREARRIIREQRIGLVHANDFQPLKWLIPAARSARIPVVLHVHLPTTEEERCYNWSHQAAHVVGVGRAALDGFIADGLPAERASVIYNAVDPARLTAGDAASLREELGLSARDVVLTAVGSLIRRKGVDVLLRALAGVRAISSDAPVKLLIAGDGPERAELEVLAASLALGDRVRFLGRRNDIGAILKHATDLALSAAREEALPLNVLEAGYFGVPTIVSDIAPHREIVRHGETGLVAAVDDPARFAAAIGELLRDPQRRRRMGAAARDEVHAHFLIDRYVREFAALYEALLSRPRRTYGWFGRWVWPRVYSEWLRRSVQRRLAPAADRRRPAVRYTSGA